MRRHTGSRLDLNLTSHDQAKRSGIRALTRPLGQAVRPAGEYVPMKREFFKRHWKLSLGAASVLTFFLLALAIFLKWTTRPYVDTAAWQLMAGVLAVFGAVVATDAWVQRIQKGGTTFWIVAGAVCVALSSVVSTLGWNQLSDWKASEERANTLMSQRQDTLRLVAAEMTVNRGKLMLPAFSEDDPELLKTRAFYPRLDSVALEFAITSGHFINEQDRKLFTQIYDLHNRITTLNVVAGQVDEGLLTVPAVTNIRTSLRKARDRLMREFQMLADTLAEYDVATHEPFFLLKE